MCLDQIQIAFALRAGNGLVVNLQACTDRFKVLGDVGSAAIRDQVLRSPIAQTGALQDRQRDPTRLGWGHGTGQHGAGIAIKHDEAPPLHPVQGKVHHTAVNEPILMRH